MLAATQACFFGLFWRSYWHFPYELQAKKWLDPDPPRGPFGTHVRCWSLWLRGGLWSSWVAKLGQQFSTVSVISVVDFSFQGSIILTAPVEKCSSLSVPFHFRICTLETITMLKSLCFCSIFHLVIHCTGCTCNCGVTLWCTVSWVFRRCWWSYITCQVWATLG